jgi:hypothetical protein
MRCLHGERGQTGAGYLGGLLLVAVIVAAVSNTGIGTAIADETERIVCRIAGGECEAPAPPAADGDDEPLQGPAPIPDGPLVVLPFPGSIAVSCSFGTSSRAPCDGPEGPGVAVTATGAVSVERSETALDEEGCPHQTLSVTTSLELEATAGVENPRAGGSLSGYLGESSTFEVTVSPDAAEAIEHGDRPPPNPVDPRTIREGESVQLSEEFYAGHGLEAEYRALQAELGYEEGRRVSSGIARVDPSTIRIYVGDEDFVRQALSLGLGVDGASISIGGEEELSSGKLHSIDVDITTPEGWAAYQQFLTTGRLPTGAGTSRPTSSDTLSYTDEARLEVELGNVTLGGQLGDSEGHVTETTLPDGSVETVRSARYNDVGIAIHERPGEDTYSLLLEGADASLIEAFQEFTGQAPDAPENGNLRLDFTEDELETLREQALDQLAHQLQRDGTLDERPTREEVEGFIDEDSGMLDVDGVIIDRNYNGLAFDLAGADSPNEALVALYHASGGGSASTAVQALIDFMWGTTDARHDDGSPPSENPDRRIPGRPVVPSCG